VENYSMLIIYCYFDNPAFANENALGGQIWELQEQEAFPQALCRVCGR